MIPVQKVKDLIQRHKFLENELSSNKIDKSKFAEMSKEYSDLNEIIKISKDYLSFDENKLELEKIISDKKSDNEIKDLAETELVDLLKNHENIEKKN